MATNRRPVIRRMKEMRAVKGRHDQAVAPVLSTRNADVDDISAGYVHMPAAHHSKAHLHRTTEIVIFVLSGHACTLWGKNLTPLIHGVGDLVYIPPRVPHAAVNLSADKPVLALEIRTDPTFTQDVVLLPGLDPAVEEQLDTLRRNHLERLPTLPPPPW
ncbi:cupin domain-containing protein [Saccharothrix sp. AJ9571]|nr:cupin domain-containing protein [Saccharothrix sp. AJ9571]